MSQLAAAFTPAFPGTFLSISGQVELHARFRPRDIAFIEGGRSMDWASYSQAGDRLAQALVKAGIQKGDRVALLASNSLWAHELLLGIWRAGAVAAPVSPLLNADGLATMLADSGARMLFAAGSYTERAAAAANTNDLPTITEGEHYGSFIERAESTPTGIELEADDPCVIIYSSGTTGAPKGIVHSHEARHNFAAIVGSQLGVDNSSLILSVIPMHSNGSWLGWLPAMRAGATTVILPAFTPDDFVEAVKRYKPTHGFTVPTVCAVLLERPDIEEVGLDCFKGLASAGSAMPAEVKQRMRELTGDGLFEFWGLTEGMGSIMTPGEMKKRPNSVGRPFISCDLRIIDDNGREAGTGEVGEVVGWSAAMMSGYWNRPVADDSLIWKDQNGKIFMRTGDVGEIDEEGFLTLRGRIKEMIISGGLNVYPIDLESVLRDSDLVKDVAVIGVPHPKWGETPVAFVIPDDGAEIDAPALKGWANEHLGKHQRLHDVVVCHGDFPRNTLGKVLKNELEQSYRL